MAEKQGQHHAKIVDVERIKPITQVTIDEEEVRSDEVAAAICRLNLVQTLVNKIAGMHGVETQ